MADASFSARGVDHLRPSVSALSLTAAVDNPRYDSAKGYDVRGRTRDRLPRGTRAAARKARVGSLILMKGSNVDEFGVSYEVIFLECTTPLKL